MKATENFKTDHPKAFCEVCKHALAPVPTPRDQEYIYKCIVCDSIVKDYEPTAQDLKEA